MRLRGVQLEKNQGDTPLEDRMANDRDKERRKFPRMDVAIDVNYHVLGIIDNLAFARTRNSSLAGFLIRTDDQIKRGVCLVLEIPWPSRLTPVRLLGRVVESRRAESAASYDTRIEFLAMNEESNELVTKVMEHYFSERA